MSVNSQAENLGSQGLHHDSFVTKKNSLRNLSLFGFLVGPVALFTGTWALIVGKADGREALLTILWVLGFILVGLLFVALVRHLLRNTRLREPWAVALGCLIFALVSPFVFGSFGVFFIPFALVFAAVFGTAGYFLERKIRRSPQLQTNGLALLIAGAVLLTAAWLLVN